MFFQNRRGGEFVDGSIDDSNWSLLCGATMVLTKHTTEPLAAYDSAFWDGQLVKWFDQSAGHRVRQGGKLATKASMRQHA